MNQIAVLSGQENILMPSHVFDAGHDLVAASDPEIVGTQLEDGTWSDVQYVEYDTNVKIAPMDAESFCLIFPRSSISKKNLILANSVGVIDSSYRGSIKVRFKYIVQPKNLTLINNELRIGSFENLYEKGDRIAQAVFFPRMDVGFFNALADEFQTLRGEGGFGSTGN